MPFRTRTQLTLKHAHEWEKSVFADDVPEMVWVNGPGDNILYGSGEWLNDIVLHRRWMMKPKSYKWRGSEEGGYFDEYALLGVRHSSQCPHIFMGKMLMKQDKWHERRLNFDLIWLTWSEGFGWSIEFEKIGWHCGWVEWAPVGIHFYRIRPIVNRVSDRHLGQKKGWIMWDRSCASQEISERWNRPFFNYSMKWCWAWEPVL